MSPEAQQARTAIVIPLMTFPVLVLTRAHSILYVRLGSSSCRLNDDMMMVMMMTRPVMLIDEVLRVAGSVRDESRKNYVADLALANVMIMMMVQASWMGSRSVVEGGVSPEVVVVGRDTGLWAVAIHREHVASDASRLVRAS